MITSFKDKETEKIWKQEFSKRLPTSIQKIAYRKLVVLARSKSLEDLRIPPSNRLEQLKGNRRGEYSIRVNDQWRICFKFSDGNAFNVASEDYH